MSRCRLGYPANPYSDISNQVYSPACIVWHFRSIISVRVSVRFSDGEYWEKEHPELSEVAYKLANTRPDV